MAVMNTNTSFTSEVANVLYSTQPEPSRHGLEQRLLGETISQLKRSTSVQIFRTGPQIDMVFSMLSGVNFLQLARLIETRAPAAIENMPILRSHREHLRNSAETAKVLAGLPALIESLRMARSDMGINLKSAGAQDE